MISSEIQHLLKLADESREAAKTGLLDPKFHRYIIDAQELREVGHYGSVNEEVTDEQAQASFQWAEEFMQAVKEYLGA